MSFSEICAAVFFFYSVFFPGASRSPQRELEWLMPWCRADWLHGCIPWKKGWGTDEVHCGGAITATQDILHFLGPLLPTDRSAIHPHTLQVELAKGRAGSRRKLWPPRERTCFAFLFDGEFRGQLVLNCALPGGQYDHCVLTWKGCRLGSYLWRLSVSQFVCGFKEAVYRLCALNAPLLWFHTTTGFLISLDSSCNLRGLLAFKMHFEPLK